LYRELDRAAQLRMLDGVPEPPAACGSFFVVDADRVATDHSLIDAVVIARWIDLPTVNGYSGQVPPGWNLRPWLDDYPAELERWVGTHTVAGALCEYRLTTREWVVRDDLAAP